MKLSIENSWSFVVRILTQVTGFGYLDKKVIACNTRRDIE
jgi:hypothetical protein